MPRARINNQITGKITAAEGLAPPQPQSGFMRTRSAEGSTREDKSGNNGNNFLGPGYNNNNGGGGGDPSSGPQFGRRARTVEYGEVRDNAKLTEAQRYQEEIKRQIQEREEARRREKERQKREDEELEAKIRREQERIRERELADIERERRVKAAAEEEALLGPAARRRKQQQQQQQQPQVVSQAGGGGDEPKFGRRARNNANDDEHSYAAAAPPPPPPSQHPTPSLPSAMSADPAAEARRRYEEHQAELQAQIAEKKRRKAEEAQRERVEQAAFDARMEKWAASDVPLGAAKQQQQQQQQQDVPSFLQDDGDDLQPAQQPLQQPLRNAMNNPQRVRFGLIDDADSVRGSNDGPPLSSARSQFSNVSGQQPLQQQQQQQPPFSQPYLSMPPQPSMMMGGAGAPYNPYASSDVTMMRDEILALLLDQRRHITALTQMQQQQQQMPYGMGYMPQYAAPIAIPPAHLAMPPPSYRNFPYGVAGPGAAGLSYQTQLIDANGHIGPMLHTTAPQTDASELLDKFLQEDAQRDTRSGHGAFDPSVAAASASAVRGGGSGTTPIPSASSPIHMDGGVTAVTSKDAANGGFSSFSGGGGGEFGESTMELSEEPTLYVKLPPIRTY